MLAKHRLLALVLIGFAFASAACSLITDVDRSKIGSGGSGGSLSVEDSGTSTGGNVATTGGSSSHDAGEKQDAANPQEDASEAD